MNVLAAGWDYEIPARNQKDKVMSNILLNLWGIEIIIISAEKTNSL